MKLSWRRILHRKGVSPIIGMVIISAVIFSVLALVLIWSASQEELKLQRQRERIQQLKLVEGESMEFLEIPPNNLSGQQIEFYNNGNAKPDIKHVYVNGDPVDFTISWSGTNARIGYINIASTTPDDLTSLKVETELGNLYSYSKPSAVIDILSIADFENSVRILLDGTKSSAVGATIIKWEWTVDGTTYEGARVPAIVAKDAGSKQITISLTVTDSTDYASPDRQSTKTLYLSIPGTEDTGEGDGYPGFGGEGAPGGIYISLGGSGGGTSVAEGRIIAFNIKNFSGRMIPLNTLRFYGVKNPSNYTCNQVYIAPAGQTLTEADKVYDGVNIGDGGIAKFSETYYIGDRDEAHIELRASSGARPQEGHIFMVILYDSATPMSYYVVTVPIRTADYTDDVEFNASDVFKVTGSGNILQGKSLDLNNRNLMSVGVAFSTPENTGDPCDDRMVEFNVAGVAYWSGSVASGSTIYLGTDTDGDDVPDTGVTWDNSRTVQFEFNFTDVTDRFFYFVYRFEDGTSIAHKIPRFQLNLAGGEIERKELTAAAGGTVSWEIDISQIDVLNTPMDLMITGLPCYCTATFSPGVTVSMPNTITLSIEVLPGAPTGLYPIVVTGNNNNWAYSCVVYLYIE